MKTAHTPRGPSSLVGDSSTLNAARYFQGSVDIPGERWEVNDWVGMQGHNWGKEHAVEYAWGQCVFPGRESNEPTTMVEGFTARVRVAGVTTPRLSALVLRRGDQEYRFDGLFDAWRQEATLTDRRWTVRLTGAGGEVRLRMDATNRPVACLAYANPDRRVSYCFNTKLANVLLEVRPREGEAFHCQSVYGGALEFLRSTPEIGLAVV